MDQRIPIGMLRALFLWMAGVAASGQTLPSDPLRYSVATPRDLEDRDIRETGVWLLDRKSL